MTLLIAYFSIALILLFIAIQRKGVRSPRSWTEFCEVFGYLTLWPISIALEFVGWLQLRAYERELRKGGFE